MSILANYALPDSADFRILATDIDPKVIAFARKGVYDERMISGVSEPFLQRFFIRHQEETTTNWEVHGSLKKLIVFKELNLLKPWPMQGKFDVIFCRNVVIYFNEETQAKLWKGFSEAMHPGAWLFLGHSERVSDKFATILPSAGMTTYRRAASA